MNKIITLTIFFALFFHCFATALAQKIDIKPRQKSELHFEEVSVSNKGILIAASFIGQNDISVFEAVTGRELTRLPKNGNLKKIFFTPEDNQLLLIYTDKVDLFDIKNNKVISSKNIDRIESSAFNSKSKSLALLNHESIVVFTLEAESLSHIRQFPNRNQAKEIKFSADGNLIFSRKNNEIDIIEFTTGEIKKTIKGINIMDFSVSDSFLGVAEINPYVFSFYDLEGNPAGQWEDFDKVYPALPISILPFNNYFGVAANDKLIFVNNKGSKWKLKTEEICSRAQLSSFAPGFVIDNKWNKIQIINFEGNPMLEISAFNYLHLGMFNDLATQKGILLHDSIISFTKDNKVHDLPLTAAYAGLSIISKGTISLACVDGTIEIWNISTEKLIFKVKHSRIPNCIQWDNENKLVYVSDFIDSSIYQYHQNGNSTLLKKEAFPITSMHLNGTKLAYGTISGDVTIAEIEAGKLVKPVTKNLFSNSITAINSIKNDFLFCSFGRTAAVKNDLSDIESARMYIGHDGYITALATTDDGNFFATAAADKKIKLWDFNKQKMIASYELDSVSANKIQFIRDQGIIFYGYDCLAGAISDTISIRKYKNPPFEVVVQSPNNNAPLKMVINKQGNLLASTDANTVKVRDLKTGFLLSEFSTKAKTINGITFTADGNILAVATGGGIECFEPLTGTSIRNINLENSGRSIHDVEAYSNIIVGINIHGWSNPLYYHKNSGLYIGELNVDPTDKIDKNIFDFKCNEDGTKKVTFGSNYVKLFETINNKEQLKFCIPRDVVGKSYEGMDVIDLSPDGKYLMYVDSDPLSLKIVGTADGKIIKTQPGILGKFGSNGNYIYMISKDKLAISNVNDSSEKILDANFDVLIKCLAYNKEADVFTVADTFGNIKMIEGKYGLVTNEINRWDQYTYNSKMSPDNKKMVFNNRSGLYLLDMQNLSKQEIPGNNYPFAAEFSPSSDKLYFRKNNTVFQQLLNTGKIDSLFTVEIGSNKINSIKISSNGNILSANNKETDEEYFFDVDSRKLLWKIDLTKVPGYRRVLVYDVEKHDGNYKFLSALYVNYGEELGISIGYIDPVSLAVTEKLTPEIKYKIEGLKGFAKEVFKKDSKIFELSPLKTYHAYMKDLKFYLSDVKTGKIIFTRDNPVSGSIEYIQFDPLETNLILGFNDGTIEFYDLTKKSDIYKYDNDAIGLKRTNSVKVNANGINSMNLYNSMLMVLGKNEMISLFDIKKDMQKIIDMVFIKDRDQIFLDKDGYYYSTKNASKYLAFKQGESIMPFERFDYTYNRPDKVMEALQKQSLVSEEIVKAYQSAYQKRILGKSELVKTTIKLPSVEVDDKLIKQVQYTQDLILPISGDGNGNNLDALQIKINGVPFFGQNGKNIVGKTWNGSITVPLSSGINNIKISVFDDHRVESNPNVLSINYVPKVNKKPDLYIVAFSVSDYQSDNDLKYAQKDGKDIVSNFSKNEIYGNIFIDTLFNKSATRSNFLALKEKLSKAKPDDHVIVFFSGHGLLDKKYDFYFATYDCDFNNPETKGLSYTEIEDVLDIIPSRKKLLFLDACHSGEFDKESKQVVSSDVALANTAQAKDNRKGSIVVKGSLGLENSFLLMQDLFSNISNSSGTIVISAATGDSYALESDKWQNGIFTFSILSGLKDMSADTDQNKKITVSELRDFVYKKVIKETDGKQKPTTRQENLEFDWQVW